MAEVGQILENPVQKERFTFLSTGAESGGDLVRARLVIEPGGAISMPHVHPHQEERWEIRAGRGRFRLGSEERLAGAGETVIAPAGTPHSLANAGPGELSMVLELRPALRSDVLFETICDLAARGAFDTKGRLRPLWALTVGREFRGEVALPHVPLGLQRAFLAMAAPVVRLAGYDRRLARSVS